MQNAQGRKIDHLLALLPVGLGNSPLKRKYFFVAHVQKYKHFAMVLQPKFSKKCTACKNMQIMRVLVDGPACHHGCLERIDQFFDFSIVPNMSICY